MPTDLQRMALPTLFRIDYNRLVLKALAGHDGYSDWLARRPAAAPMPGPPGHGAMPYPLAPLVAAARDLPASRFKRHALGSLAAGLALNRDLAHGGPAPPVPPGVYEQMLADFFDHATFQAIRHAPPNEAYILGAFASTPAACQIANVKETCTLDQFDVTTATIEFDCSRPVLQLPVNFDPRLWDTRAQEVFADADRIEEGPLDFRLKPARTETDAKEEEQGGKAWEGLLYENAIAANTIVSSGGASSELIEFKNVLWIRFAPRITGPVGGHQIELDYQLDEGLTIQLFDSLTVAGGLDRDSGIIRVVPKDGGSRHFMSKSLRIARPEDRRAGLNFGLAVVLQFWLYNMTVLGVCE